MSSKVFEPTELFKYLKKHKGSNKRNPIVDENNVLFKYADAQIDEKIFEFRKQDIIPYYLTVKNKKYNIINALTGLPHFFPNVPYEINKDQKITFFDNKSNDKIQELITNPIKPEDNIPLFIDLKTEYKTKYNTIYSYMHMCNLFSKIVLFVSADGESDLKKNVEESINVFMRDLIRGYYNIYLEQTNTYITIKKNTENKTVSDDEANTAVHETYNKFINDELPSLYKDPAKLFMIQYALHYLTGQESSGVIREIFNLLFGLEMKKIESDLEGNKIDIKISKDGNYVSCSKLYTLASMGVLVTVNDDNKLLNDYHSMVYHTLIDCTTYNFFIKVYIIKNNPAELPIELDHGILDSLSKIPKLLKINNISVRPYNYQELDINSNIFKKVLNQTQITFDLPYKNADNTTTIVYKFNYDLTFGYINYVDYLFKQLPGSTFYLNKLNEINRSEITSITDTIIKINSNSLLDLIFLETHNFAIYQIIINNLPIYISVGKISIGTKTKIIIYLYNITSDNTRLVQTDNFTSEYNKIITTFTDLAQQNTNISIFSYKQTDIPKVYQSQLSLLTLMVLFESITNYIILFEKHNKHKDLQITSHTYNINNFGELVEYYSSQLAHFDKIAKITTQKSYVASPRTLNVASPRTLKVASPRTLKVVSPRTLKIASPRTLKVASSRTLKVVRPRSSVTNKSRNSNSIVGSKELLIGRPRANAMRQSNAIPV